MTTLLNRLVGDRRLLVTASVLYLSLIFGLMLTHGISIEPEWVLIALLTIAVVLRRGVQFLRDWSPFLVLLLAYEALRGLAGSGAFPVRNLAPLERWLFFGHVPTIELQTALYRPHNVSPQDAAAVLFYLLHFVVPLVVGFVFWVNSRPHYWRYVSALLLMSYAAFVTFLFVPTAPPWWQFPHGVHDVVNETFAKWGVNFIWPLYSHLNPDWFAAFPSLHAGYPALSLIFAWSQFRKLGIVLLFWTAGAWASIVYLGEHYIVDALGGLAYAALAAATVHYVSRALHRHRQQLATAYSVAPVEQTSP